jgi:hypothetical protein
MCKQKHRKEVPYIELAPESQEETPPENYVARYDRARAMDSYASNIGNADSDALRHLQNINRQIQRSFSASITISSIILGIAILVLGASIYVFLANPGANNRYQHIFSVISFIGSFALLAGLIAKNPLSNLRHLIGSLAKLNVLFLGYVRQLNIIDATFRDFYINSSTIGAEEMHVYLEKVQDALDETIGNVSQLIDELEN